MSTDLLRLSPEINGVQANKAEKRFVLCGDAPSNMASPLRQQKCGFALFCATGDFQRYG